MPSEIQHQLRSIQLKGAGFVLAIALAIIGLVWLSQWAVNALRPQIDFPAEAAIGLLCLVPLLVLVLGRRGRSQDEYREQETTKAADLAQISSIAQNLVEKSPFTALAVAALAGVLAVRFPSALTLLLQVLSPQRV